nr:MAG TPA: YTH domain-containing protein [Caudoviricetes sp.]
MLKQLYFSTHFFICKHKNPENLKKSLKNVLTFQKK